MKKVAIVGCGNYMSQCFACPGDWKCLKAATLGEGTFEEESQVVAFVRCECPGRTVAPNTGFALKLAEMKPDAIYLSTCMAVAKPECPYHSAEEFAEMLTAKTGVEVVLGTHEYM
jgi:predicted metal-binding protein